MVVEAGPTMVESNIKSILESKDSKSGNVLNLVLGVDALLKIRKKVCNLYVDKKIIIAPCLTKVYISREQQIIDCDGKTTPDWFYFGTGVIAIIYDPKNECLKIALFEDQSIRLLWCMNWAQYVTICTQTSNFHILNTKEDYSQHVGFLYENKDVADLMLNTINLISSSISQNNVCVQCETQRNKQHNKKKLTKQSESVEEEENATKLSKRRSSLRESLLRRAMRQKSPSPTSERKATIKQRSCTVIGTFSSQESRSDTVGKDSIKDRTFHSIEQTSTDTTSDEKLPSHKKITALTRANSFRRAIVHNSSIDEESESTTKTQQKNITDSENNNSNIQNPRDRERKQSREHTEKEGIIRTIFRKRRISRTQSLKIISPKRDSQISQTNETTEDKVTLQTEEEILTLNQPDSKRYQRARKLMKPRSSTDSLLLRGEAIQNIIETGHVARYARQRRQIAKRLEQTDLQATDLCVTEL